MNLLVFMLYYYRLPGLTADLALIVYTIVSLATMVVGGFVMTLPGIAGFILAIGMAVDANVLIFESLDHLCPWSYFNERFWSNFDDRYFLESYNQYSWNKSIFRYIFPK